MSEGGGYYRQTLSRGGAGCGRGCHSIYSAHPSQRVQAHIVPEISIGGEEHTRVAIIAILGGLGWPIKP